MYNITAARIKDLPEDKRPRERLHKYEAERLKDSELLAVILKSGFKTIHPAISNRVRRTFGRQNN